MFCVIIFVILGRINCYPIPKITREYLWTEEETPTDYAHVCTITELDNGDFLAAYQAGMGEGKPNCTIWKSLRASNGSWGTPEIAIKMDKCTMNPSLYQNDEGTIFLMYHYNGKKHDDGCHTHSWKGYYATSNDGGKTFVDYKREGDDLLGSVKNQCIKMTNGEVLCPSSIESAIWSSHMETTNDDFTDWKKRNNIFFFHGEKWCQGVIQPAIFESETQKGKIRAMLRSSCGILATAVSTDYGHNWPEYADKTDIVNPGAGIDVVMMKETKLGALMAFNNSTKGRNPMTIAYTFDDGENWTKIMDIDSDPGGSYEYPFIVQNRKDPNVAHVCYTYKLNGYHSFAFVTLDFNS